MDQVLDGVTVYGGIGAALALVFLTWGIDRVDAAAHGAWLVRLVLFPSVVVLWPIVLWRWAVLERRRALGRGAA